MQLTDWPSFQTPQTSHRRRAGRSKGSGARVGEQHQKRRRQHRAAPPSSRGEERHQDRQDWGSSGTGIGLTQPNQGPPEPSSESFSYLSRRTRAAQSAGGGAEAALEVHIAGFSCRSV